MSHHVIIIGAGFAGLNVSKVLGKNKDIQVTLIDRQNHHLFQPLLYQVATAGLSPAEIAVPIRHILAPYLNIRVLQEEVVDIDLTRKTVTTCGQNLTYNTLVLACGSRHSYFGNEGWEPYAPGLKTLEQATEIRRRILSAFEEAEKTDDPHLRKKYLTFVIVGGGPTGVELAGAIGEMSRYTLARDFRQIDPKQARIILIEAGPSILPSFSEREVGKVVRDLESMGVQVWCASKVSQINADGVCIGNEKIEASTVLWAAGVTASNIGKHLGLPTDEQGRIVVKDDLSVSGHPEVFVAGDLAHFKDDKGKILPGLAPVAIQEGKWVAKNILNDLMNHPREPFLYRDKGQLATVGRSRAIAEIGKIRMTGGMAWILWLTVHVYYLIGFKNRLFVLLQWAWSYLRFSRGARLILGKDWRFYKDS